MKKLLSAVLTAALTISMSTAVFAANYDAYLDKQPVVPKKYEINNGTAPAEDFTFKFTGVSYKNGDGEVVADANIPAIDDVTVSFDALSATASKDGKAVINADDYALGVYTYKVEETAGNTAGVTYSDEDLYLVLTILRDENSNKHYVAAMHYQDATGTDKSTGFTNKYDAGQLSVTKNIKGNMAIMEKEFDFTITFTAPSNEVVKSAITVTKPDQTTEVINFVAGSNTCTYEIALGHEDTVTFTNLPEGVTYEVTEDAENYTATSVFSDTAKTIAANDTDTVVFTNELTNEVDTGIVTDSLPYVVMLAFVAAGLVVVISKKRMMHE